MQKRNFISWAIKTKRKTTWKHVITWIMISAFSLRIQQLAETNTNLQEGLFFKSMRYRRYRKRIDRFASKLQLWRVFDCPQRKRFENDRISRCDVSACYKHTHLRYFRSSFSFWCFFNRFRPPTLIGCVCVLFPSNFKGIFNETLSE